MWIYITCIFLSNIHIKITLLFYPNKLVIVCLQRDLSGNERNYCNNSLEMKQIAAKFLERWDQLLRDFSEDRDKVWDKVLRNLWRVETNFCEISQEMRQILSRDMRQTAARSLEIWDKLLRDLSGDDTKCCEISREMKQIAARSLGKWHKVLRDLSGDETNCCEISREMRQIATRYLREMRQTKVQS
jgi:predicted secreted Zn-dependent protease